MAATAETAAITGPCARREEKPEAHPEEEAAADVAWPAPAERRERSLEESAQRGYEEREAEHDHDCDRDVPEQVVGKPERRQERGRREREHREARDEPGHDRVRSARFARGAPGEHDRKNGEHAGRDRRNDPCHERDSDENEHLKRVPPSEPSAPTPLARLGFP